MENIDNAISSILALAIKAETTPSQHEKQVVKMQAGKVRKFLRNANDEAKADRSGVKLSN